MDVDWK